MSENMNTQATRHRRGAGRGACDGRRRDRGGVVGVRRPRTPSDQPMSPPSVRSAVLAEGSFVWQEHQTSGVAKVLAGRYVTPGKLKATSGNHNDAISAGTDLAGLRSV
jgi:hypothetical protein